MKICITGGSGFVGSRLIEELLRYQYEVVNIDRRPSPFFPQITTVADIRNKPELNKVLKGCDLVVHLAAEHRDDVSPTSLYYDVNVDATHLLLKTMDEHGIKRVIFTSTVAVYGLNKINPDENFNPDPFNHYGISKWKAEEKIVNWQKQDVSKAALILRPTVIFGERNRGNVYNLFKQIASGDFIQIGSGTNKKSMAYVGNVTAYIIHALQQGFSGTQVINYADKPDLTINELVNTITTILGRKIPSIKIPYMIGILIGYVFDLIAKIRGKSLPISSIRIKKFCATTQFDSSKAFSNGYSSPYTMQQALENTLSFEFLREKKDDILFISE